MVRVRRLGILVLLVGLGGLVSNSRGESLTIGDPSFESGTMYGGFGNGWNNFGAAGGVWWNGSDSYDGSYAYTQFGANVGGPYQATNNFYAANKIYTITFHARQRMVGETGGQVKFQWGQMAADDTAFYDGSPIGGPSTQIFSVTGDSWNTFSMTLDMRNYPMLVGTRMVLSFAFPGSTYVLLDAISIEAVDAPATLPIGDPSFESGTMYGGFGNGWNNFGAAGGVWYAGSNSYVGSYAYTQDGPNVGGPYQATNNLYAANKLYTITFHARQRTVGETGGQVKFQWEHMAAGDTAYYNGNPIGGTASQTFALVGDGWNTFSLSLDTRDYPTLVGERMVLSFAFPGSTYVLLDLVFVDVVDVPADLTIGDPSFESGSLHGGFGNGWDNFGAAGGIWGDPYVGSCAYNQDSPNVGGPYQATNDFYAANKIYTVIFHARQRTIGETGGQVKFQWCHMPAGDTAYYDGNPIGGTASQTFTLSGDGWNTFTMTLDMRNYPMLVGERMVLSFAFPGTTYVVLDAVHVGVSNAPAPVLQNAAFNVPGIAEIVCDGNISDWSTSTAWSDAYIWWNGTELISTTNAKFAYSGAAKMLYVAIQTNEHSVRGGGHAVVGLSSNPDSIPMQNLDSTQLAFDYDTNYANKVHIYNETGGVTTGVKAGCTYDEATGLYTYEIAIPLWDSWTSPSAKKTLSANGKIYLYSCMESEYGSGNGMDMTYHGNPLFYRGAFDYGSVLTLLEAEKIPGDANGDFTVDVGDLGILAANYGGTSKTWSQGDFNGDGVVDVGDLGILAAHYGTNASSADFAADYAQAFGTAAEDNLDEADTAGSSICSSLGLPLIAGLALMGFMLVKLDE